MRPGLDYIGVGVGAVIVDCRGRLFLARRGPGAANEKGRWEFPGGAVHFGETLAEALQREMQEEFGIDIAVGELLDVVDHILPEEQQHWVSATFLCSLTSGEPCIREPEKCSDIGWFHPDKLPAGLSRVTQANIRHYRQRRSGSRNPRCS